MHYLFATVYTILKVKEAETSQFDRHLTERKVNACTGSQKDTFIA